jgi:uncharacterized protein DUF4255
VSTALAIAGVTQVLRDLLNDELVNSNVAGDLGQSVTVTTLPPDRVVPENGTEASQLNVFLRHVTPNSGWRNEEMPSRDGAGRTRLSNPPLALNLHYVISAYGAEPLHAEILLGYAMQLLHENPAIPRDVVRASINANADPDQVLPEALRSLAHSGLADQVEQLRITPEYLSTEDMSKFWTATLAHYRPCAAYQVSVVLIQKENPRPVPLPVLIRNVGARPNLRPRVPAIIAVTPANKLPVAQLGRPVTLEGFNLAGTTPRVLLTNDRFEVLEELDPDGGTAVAMKFTIPTGRSADFPVGIYRVGARLQPTGDDRLRESNHLALTVAPRIDGAPTDVSRNGTTASFTLHCLPAIRRGQLVRLAIAGQEYAPQLFTTPTTTSLKFEVPNMPTTEVPVSLRVDGIESPMIDVEAKPPAFNQKIHIP